MSKPINAGSVLQRRQWASQVLVGAQQRSVFGPFSGDANAATMINRASGMGAGNNGHLVHYPGLGTLTGRYFEGNEDASGKGEKLRLFSSTLKAQWFRSVTELYNKYDRVEVGEDTSLGMAGMRRKLTDQFTAWNDQYLFDVVQGVANRTMSPSGEGRATHGKRFAFSGASAKFGFNELQEVENIASEGAGFDWGGSRVPLPGMRMAGMNSMWLLFVDPKVHEILKTDAGFQNIVKDADVRGMQNKLLSPVLGTLGQIMIVKMPRAKGTLTTNSQVGYQSHKSDGSAGDNPGGFARRHVSVEACGMRQYNGENRWTGQPGFSGNTERWSRCVLLGANALQVGFSMLPTIELESNNTNNVDELSLHVFMGAQKSKWDAEAEGDYDDAKSAGLDYGAIAIDVQTAS